MYINELVSNVIPRHLYKLILNVCCRNIKRIVFYSLKKLTGLADGGVKVDLIDPSQALQISGRAGNNK